MKCVICNEKITADPNGWEGGCNAEPVASGQCCGFGIKMKGGA